MASFSFLDGSDPLTRPPPVRLMETDWDHAATTSPPPLPQDEHAIVVGILIVALALILVMLMQINSKLDRMLATMQYARNHAI